ncbi:MULTISPECIES: universal stress protein [unclassified Variovorax]|uniref:universal stress protein n=1 Tax=unclassified Variovorax TaxID=663243 RepID=UPI00076C683F|nr:MULTISPECIES: universal stress protein [unclassified Variovorax]KWT82843.1 universal stress protein family [Variovorax sp. WDL1]PNG52432.1 Universal stress protein G [Variovorax sp. B4]PNG54972.1 Universal stress protein G [Variovorax sp. B2]VTV15993.1 Universal stress protein G [Variovorax sp. WDL1]
MTDLAPILAATDFSTPARHAADRAARLAHENGAALTLMHVLPGGALQELRRWLGADHAMEHQLHDDAQRQLDMLIADLQTHRHVAARAVNASGSVVDEITREAEVLDAAMLVLGARGAGFLRRSVLGSTSERLLRRTVRPLLVVRQRPHEPYRRVLVALDFSPWSAQSVSLARRVAPHGRLLLFHACQVPFEEKLRFAGVDAATIDHYRTRTHADATQRLHALAAASGLKPGHWEPCIVEGDASQRIVEHEQDKDCDLVVLGKHGQSAAEDLLLGSVSKHVLAEGSADVLVSAAHAA